MVAHLDRSFEEEDEMALNRGGGGQRPKGISSGEEHRVNF